MSSDKLHAVPEDKVKKPRHETCHLPACVREHTGEPLYILVAHWCLQQQDWVNRCQLSEAFRIPVRRASYLMAYLRNRTSRVVCETRETMLSNNVYRYEIYVTCVREKQAKSLTSSRKRPPRRTGGRTGNGDSSQANALWNSLRKGHQDKSDGGKKDD